MQDQILNGDAHTKEQLVPTQIVRIGANGIAARIKDRISAITTAINVNVIALATFHTVLANTANENITLGRASERIVAFTTDEPRSVAICEGDAVGIDRVVALVTREGIGSGPINRLEAVAAA